MINILLERANHACELCENTVNLKAYPLEASPDNSADSAVLLCATCYQHVNSEAAADAAHFQCLNKSMWSLTPAVQVLSYRLLHDFSNEAWAQNAIDMLYLDDALQDWADRGLMAAKDPTLDVNGLALKAGDSVTIIKDLEVKGANFTAKRGTAVRNIGLSDNPLHIEGRVNGQRIVLIAAYTKKN